MMDTVNYVYNGKLWKSNSTLSGKNSFFHAAFGIRNEDELYLDKQAKYRRSRWATFLNYFENENMSQPLTNILKKCLSVNVKYKHIFVEDQNLFEGYIWDIMKAEHDITIEEISILVTLENVKVVLFKDEESKPIIINPDVELLGNYPHREEPKGEVVLHMKGNIFSRMNLFVEKPLLKLIKSGEKTANVQEGDVELASSLIKYKKGGTAGIEGVQFQVSLLTVFVLNAFQKLRNWKLSTENTTAGKFDDVVLEWSEGTTLLQAKHKQNKTKKITLEELVSTNSKNDDFSIPKYFLSYEQIKKIFKIKEVIICTNASVHGKAMRSLKTHKVDPESMLHYETHDCKFYMFSDEILPCLKENIKSYYEKNFQNKEFDQPTMTDANINDFLGHLKLFFNYPPTNDIGKVIEQLLSQMKLSDNSYIQISSAEIYTKMLNWFQQKDGVFITELYAKAIFSEIWRDKHWQRLEKYEIFFQCNNLNFQSSKQLFYLSVEGGCLLQVMKVFYVLQSSKTKFLFANLDDGAVKTKLVMEAFGMPQYSILVLVWPKFAQEFVMNEDGCKLREILNTFGYKKVVLIADPNNKIPHLIGLSYDIINKSTFQDLSEDSQEELLKTENIIFQGNDISLKEILALQAPEDYAKFLTNEGLEKLVRGEKIKVGAPVLELDDHITQFYIKRKFKRRDEIFPEELIYAMNEKIVLISDSAGTGKSTVLTNLAVTMKKKCPHLWIIRIDLNDYTQILKDYLQKNKTTISILELLNSKNSTKLTNQLEQSVILMNEKVVLMLDGFDEISPDYTELLLSLLSYSRDQQNFAKLIVTTRPYAALELETKLQVEPFILEPFTEQNQIDFLTGYWMRNLDVDNSERHKCEEYAKALIKKMSSWVQLFEQGTNHFAAIPLHVRMLAEIFQNNQLEMLEDWEGCKEHLVGDGTEPKLPENMNVTRLYKMFIEKKRSVFIDKGNPYGNTTANRALIGQFKECLVYHRKLALELILDKSKCKLFSCCRQTPENLDINVLKIGIVQKANNIFQFVHRTFAEYFVAESFIEELQLPNENVEFQKFLIEEILLKPQVDVIGVFFNSFLQQVIDNLCPQCVSYKISYFDANKFNLLNNIVRNGLLAIFQLILKCVDLNFFTKVPTGSIQFFGSPAEESISKYSNILNVVQHEAYVKSIFKGITFLEHAVERGHLEMVKFLVKHGANVDVGNLKPLHLAVNGGHFEVAKLLVDQGANIRAKDSFYGTTVLCKAVSRNDTAMASYLLERMLWSEGLNITDFIIPYMAAYLGRLDIIQNLMEQYSIANGRVESGEPVIFGAIRGGQLETVKYLVQHGYDINSRDLQNNTALHVISQKSSLLSTAEMLVEIGIDVNAKNFKFSTALHIAVETNNFELVELLVNHGVDVNLENAEGNTALHIATEHLRGNIVKFLVQHSANINSRNKYSCTALHLATEQQCSVHFQNVRKQSVESLGIVKFLIKSGGDVNIQNMSGLTVLHVAAKTGQLDVIVLLVEFGVDADITDNNGRTALHWAAFQGYKHIVKFLVQHNADVNIRDNNGNTLIHYLVHFISEAHDRCDILRLVIENGGDVNLRNSNSRTALHLTTSGGDLDVVIILLEFGIDVNIRDDEGCTGLHLAAKEGHFNILEYLLKNGVDITATNNSGYTVLHFVADRHKLLESPVFWRKNVGISNFSTEYFATDDDVLKPRVKPCFMDLGTRKKDNYFDIVENIVTECSELVDIKDRTGRTALHLAALKGNLEVVKLLVQHGADANNQNDGYTVLHTAVCVNHVEMAKFLLEWGVDADIRDNKGRRPLHLAVEKNTFDIMVLLVEFGVDVNARDKVGSTPLHDAVSRGHFNIVKYLVEAGADIRIRNNCGYTALHLAAIAKKLHAIDDKCEGAAGTLDVFICREDDILDDFIYQEDDLLDDFICQEDDILDDFIPVEDTERKHLNSPNFSINTTLIHRDFDVEYFGSSPEIFSTSVNFTGQLFNLDIIKILLARCNNAVDIKDELGCTALHLAILKGHLALVEVLLKHNVNINVKDNQGRTALQLAVDDGKLEIVKLLVEYGTYMNDHDSNIDWFINSKNHQTALHLAADRGELNTLIFFAELGIDVNIIDDEGHTALQLALDRGHLSVIKYLVEKGADVTGTKNYERTVLHLAAKSGNLDIMTFFVKRCTDVSVTDKDGNTALHSAVHVNSLDIVKLLMDFGIDLTVKNSAGRTALHLASNRGCLNIVNFLVQHGADLNVIDNRGSTPLHLAVCCSLDLVTFLVEQGADIYLKNYNGDTAAIVAKKKGCLDVFNYLHARLNLKNTLFC